MADASQSRNEPLPTYADLERLKTEADRWLAAVQNSAGNVSMIAEASRGIRALIESAYYSPPSEIRPISEVSIPLTEAINEPCKGCGKRPIDFISGAQGNDPAPGRWGVTGVPWNGCTHPWVGDPKVMPKKWTCYCGTVVYRSREDAVDD